MLLDIKDLQFTYAGSKNNVLNGIDLQVEKGDFIALCGASGSGKSTLLKLIKSELAPNGITYGEILFNGEPITKLSIRGKATKIGYVSQNVESQIVCDKVYSELAFGLENIGLPNDKIKCKIAEISSAFGLESWFRKDIKILSGGEKQLLNLASVMAMGCGLLLLDEPTSQLDPIAKSEFFSMLHRLNEQFGVTIIIAEQRLEETFSYANKVVVIDKGKVIVNDNPSSSCEIMLKEYSTNKITQSLPTSARLAHTFGCEQNYPVTIKQGIGFVDKFLKFAHEKVVQSKRIATSCAINIKNAYFSYDKSVSSILRGLNLQVGEGEIFCLLGGNGAGKTTLLNAIAGAYKLNSGNIEILGKNIKNYKDDSLYNECLAKLPQNVDVLFCYDTVAKEIEQCGADLFPEIDVNSLLDKHPHDLSGGEKQKLAIKKLLHNNPKILLLDEPTQGLDGYEKQVLSGILHTLSQKGITALIVSHDIEFCAKIASRLALLFDGECVSCDIPQIFLSQNNFYTTASNRIVRHKNKYMVTINDIVAGVEK